MVGIDRLALFLLPSFQCHKFFMSGELDGKSGRLERSESYGARAGYM